MTSSYKNLGSIPSFSEEYRNSDEYKVLAKYVIDAAPNLPQPLVEQAIFMHKMDPNLYKKWTKLEKEYGAELKADTTDNKPVEDESAKDNDVAPTTTAVDTSETVAPSS